MAMIFAEGLEYISNYFFGKTLPHDIKLKLYVNDFPPVIDNVTSDYVICSANGYNDETLLESKWFGSMVGAQYSSVYNPITWNFTPGTSPAQTVYGWIVVEETDDLLLFGGALVTPLVIPTEGIAFTLGPKFNLGNCS